MMRLIALKGLILVVTGTPCVGLWVVFPFSIVALVALSLFIVSTIALVKA